MDTAASLLRERLLEIAGQCGASLAGIARAAQLGESPSHLARGRCFLPESARSVLVLALHHGQTDAELDYWGGEGGTPGNLRLIRICRHVAERAARELHIIACPIDYAPEPRGTFLKDAATLAGLGIIGSNNLLVTPRFGPRVRLRALALEVELPPSTRDGFSPCSSCDMVCRTCCPRHAFARGGYAADDCMRQMKEDESRAVGPAHGYRVAYCRRCELSCPVGSRG
jgi:epoxyqueuosine reductase